MRAPQFSETKRVLVTVKTYPTPSWSSIESSCTAGVTDKSEWIRLYPIPFRLLESSKQFKRYQRVEVNVRKATTDARPESYRVDPDSITVLGPPLDTKDKWRARKAILAPLATSSLCELDRLHRLDKRSLGFFKPRQILGLEIESLQETSWSEAEEAKLMQDNMFLQRPAYMLEKVPFKFYYRFTCDDPTCRSHRISCHDWEIHQSYREWKRQWPKDWEAKLRQKYEREMIELNDTHFYMGTLAAHQDTWIIIGLFYPRK